MYNLDDIIKQGYACDWYRDYDRTMNLWDTDPDFLFSDLLILNKAGWDFNIKFDDVLEYLCSTTGIDNDIMVSKVINLELRRLTS